MTISILELWHYLIESFGNYKALFFISWWVLYGAKWPYKRSYCTCAKNRAQGVSLRVITGLYLYFDSNLASVSDIAYSSFFFSTFNIIKHHINRKLLGFYHFFSTKVRSDLHPSCASVWNTTCSLYTLRVWKRKSNQFELFIRSVHLPPCPSERRPIPSFVMDSGASCWMELVE